jgi:acyl-CoA-binding protein
MLRFYGLFKQATEGKNNLPKPSFWAVITKAKWDAWKNLGNMPKEEAMKKYVDELKQVSSFLFVPPPPHADTDWK